MDSCWGDARGDQEEKTGEGGEDRGRRDGDKGGSKVRAVPPGSQLNHFHPHPTGQTRFTPRLTAGEAGIWSPADAQQGVGTQPQLVPDVPLSAWPQSPGGGGGREDCAAARFSWLSVAHLRCPGLSPLAKARPTGPGWGMVSVGTVPFPFSSNSFMCPRPQEGHLVH